MSNEQENGVTSLALERHLREENYPAAIRLVHEGTVDAAHMVGRVFQRVDACALLVGETLAEVRAMRRTPTRSSANDHDSQALQQQIEAFGGEMRGNFEAYKPIVAGLQTSVSRMEKIHARAQTAIAVVVSLGGLVGIAAAVVNIVNALRGH